MIRLTPFMLIVLFIIMVPNIALTALTLPRAKVTIRVVDEMGGPIERAIVGIGFERNTGWGVREIPVEGLTDKDGLFSGSAFSINHIGFTITKEGYYLSVGEYDFENYKFGHWLPWNPEIKVELRKLENPVPMYARDFNVAPLEIPVEGVHVGFDLMESDWVTPYGSGQYSDFIFFVDRNYISDRDFEGRLTLSFSNKWDGIQVFKDDRKNGSEFRLPRYAPDSGYQPELEHFIRNASSEALRVSFAEDINYFFRIRSEERNGEVFRAMYGKVQGDIRFDLRNAKIAIIGFKYFLNPDYTRNLEYDPKRNLSKSLKKGERVGLR